VPTNATEKKILNVAGTLRDHEARLAALEALLNHPVPQTIGYWGIDDVKEGVVTTTTSGTYRIEEIAATSEALVTAPKKPARKKIEKNSGEE
jgi:hypothetical protein